jgi:pantoate--beta-alanine ligase
MNSKMMMIVSTIAELRSARSILEGPVGLVPTMGALHEGHLSLVRQAALECVSVVVSLFVNPSQFSPTEDLSSYPRDLEHDLRLLEPLGVDLVWTPTAEIMYPDNYQTWVQVEELTRPLEGAIRPEHFRGVSTVVAKLFNGVQPARAYFGQKDAQQAAVIRQMTRDLNFPIEIVVCPTVRESDGLAMSSRNAYLNSEERLAATVLFRALTSARQAFDQGERDARKLRENMGQVLDSEPLAQAQYVSCADYETLQELDQVTGKTLLSLAVMIGRTRLIDNMVLE